MNFISPDSRCFSFDDRANGYGRGEGVGVLVLKRLGDALNDGDTIRAVVCSTGSNQDGRTPGITQPSRDAQELLIKETYQKARLDMRATRYVEAHGTGTVIGDPIEASAIGRAFHEYRSPEDPMYIGAVKSNVGHLEGGSGVAGIIKTIMVLESGIIPPNANFEQMNPGIDAEFLKITFPRENTIWPCKGLRRASISSFGFGGSNCHAILDDAYNFLRLRGLTGNHCTTKEPAAGESLSQYTRTLTHNIIQQAADPDHPELRPKLLVWSVADEGGIARLTEEYSTFMTQVASSLTPTEASVYLESLAYTLAARRTSLSWKSFVLASSLQELQNIAPKMSKPVRSKENPKLGFVFTGQGAQFAEMAKELMVFPSCEYHGAMISVGLSVDDIEHYFDQVSLHFGSRGIIVGCINSPKNVTVTGDERQVDVLKSLLDKDRIFARKLQVNVAYHSPQMGTIAADYLLSIKNLQARDAAPDSCKMISSVTGQNLSIDEMQEAEYWVKNMTSPVRFTDAMIQIDSAASKSSTNTIWANARTSLLHDLLEIGPHCALKGPIREHLESRGIKDINYSSALIRYIPATNTLLDAVGRLYCAGYAVDVSEVNSLGKTPRDRQIVLPNLPEYHFDHSRSYWHESRFTKEGWRLRKYPRLDLLGSPVPDWNPLHATWRKIIRLSETPWVEDHKVNGTIVYPAAAMLVMAFEASKQLADVTRHITGFVIKDATFHSALTIASEAEEVETQIQLRPLGDSSSKSSSMSDFRVSMNIDGHWSENCRGVVQLEYEVTDTEVDAGSEAVANLHEHRQLFAEAVVSCDQVVDTKELYEHLKEIGLWYGPAFQVLHQAAYNHDGEATGKVRTFQWTAKENTNHFQPHIIHPTSLDALLHLMIVALFRGTEETHPTMMVTRIGRLWISSSGISFPSNTEVNVYAHAEFIGSRRADARMFALDQRRGDLLLSMENIEATTVATRGAPLSAQGSESRLCYDLKWKPDLDLMGLAQIKRYCESTRPNRTSANEFYEDLGLVLLLFMSNTLESLENRESLQPHLRRYIHWLQCQVGRFHAGELANLTPDNPKWRSLVQDTEYRENICTRLGTTIQGGFFLRIGENLPGILKGDVDPLAFMFQGDLIPEFYREVNQKVICYEPLNRYLDILSHNNPSLKVLEIGAGTGATTDFILDALSTSRDEKSKRLNCTNYDYTDISPAFFEAAKERYESYLSKLRFKALDIEHDPFEQGFEVGTYDLVIAASVLHATKNLEVTMHNARKLLKPGGKFVIFEITQDALRAGFAFGLLPGWWLSEEDYRLWGPCIPTREWHDLMCRTGFSGVDLEVPDYLDEACHEYSIIVSSAIVPEQDSGPNPTSTHLQISNITIIVDDNSSLQQGVGSELRDRLRSSETIDCDVMSLEQATISNNLDQRFCILLNEVESPFLVNVDAHTLLKLQHILTSVPGLLWVTNGGEDLAMRPESHLVDGFARVLRTEFNKLIFVTLALEKITQGSESVGQKIHRVFEKIMSQSIDDFESEFKEKDGIIEIGRLLQADDLNEDVHFKTQRDKSGVHEFGHGPPLTLHVGSPGLLNSLLFLEDARVREPLAPGDVEIRVEASGVNFRDCLTALGQIDSKHFGSECSGVVSRVGDGCNFKPGDRVAALFVDTYSTYARGSSQCVAKIPDEMSYVEASAIPVVFLTSWYAFFDVARLQREESVLIHAGAGGTGQAAIQVAQYIGAEVYTTVGSNEKKALLMTEYNIPEDHIFYSRNTSFAQGVARMTKGRGVDVVLNSLSGEGLIASWECIAPFGRFVEIGKRDILSHGSLPMWQFRNNATFSSIDFQPIVQERPSIIYRIFQDVIALIVAKRLRVPRPFQILGVCEIEEALRLFQSGRNSGKMVIEMREKDLVHTVLETKPDYQFGSESSYLIAGGLGGLGRSAARWMASRGARNLILLSRSGARSKAALSLVEELTMQGICVKALACDVADAISLSTTLMSCAETMPPIRGVIQGAMVLRDTIFEKMTFEDWKLCMAPKVKGSWNLHDLLPRGMDFFICLSSVSGVVGGGGQANYAAANTYMDALVRYRTMRGEKATALDLGWMESEGVAAENSSLSTSLAATGCLIPISSAQYHALLDHYCNPGLSVTASSATQAVIGLDIPATMRAKGMKEPHWMQRRTSRPLRLIGLHDRLSAKSETTVDYVALFRNAASLEEASKIVMEGLLRKLSRALSIPEEEMDTSKPLHTYGVDSLLAVELRNYFAKEMEADMAIFDIMGGSSIDSVSMLVSRKSRFRQASWAKAED
ncbi:MAG: hypothetical protein Q9161_001964 [Pseudevernia consocians]